MTGNSFLHLFEAGAADVGKGALNVLTTVGPSVAQTVAGAFGGPLAGSIAGSLVNSVVAAERAHVAAGSPPAVPGAPDPRKQQVLDQFRLFMPVIELAAQALGHPIVDKPAFEAALPQMIDATVSEFNALSALMRALEGVAK